MKCNFRWRESPSRLACTLVPETATVTEATAAVVMLLEAGVTVTVGVVGFWSFPRLPGFHYRMPTMKEQSRKARKRKKGLKFDSYKGPFLTRSASFIAVSSSIDSSSQEK
jgi:hypothetical protein